MTLLTIALFIDAIINIARIVETERGMRFQRQIFAQEKRERDAIVAEVIGAGGKGE